MTRTDRLRHALLLLAFFVLYAISASIAFAQTACTKVASNKAHVCWTHDGKLVDGTTATGITFDVELQSGSTWTKVATGLTATDWTSGVLAAGTYTYRVLAFKSVYSDPSNTASLTVAPSPPTPPTGVVVAQVSITISAPAFRIIGRYPNAEKGDFIGMVPVGRDCTGPVLFRAHGYSFRAVMLKKSEGWQEHGPVPAVAAAPCVRQGA